MTIDDTRQSILRVARGMVQAHGYNALSFREVAKDVGIKSASVHHHFPTKGDLALALARQYTVEASVYLEGFLAATQDRQACLDGYADAFRAALSADNRMCLCGILSAEVGDLPADVQIEVAEFGTVNVQWLTRVLALGPAPASLEARQRRALSIYAAIGGAQLTARGRNDIAVYDQIVAEYRSAGLLR